MTIRIIGPSRTPYRDHYAKVLDRLRNPPTPHRDAVQRYLDVAQLPALSDAQCRALDAKIGSLGTNPMAFGSVEIDGVRYRTRWADSSPAWEG